MFYSEDKGKYLLITNSILFILLFFTSCSTKKNTFTRRLYHNLNAHYNAYFNGNESLKDGIYQINTSHQDVYTKVLPVFRYSDEQKAQAAAAKLDRATTKATLVIKRHSIFIKREEHCRWIDDSYMMIGKANFYKMNYSSAAQTFEYVLTHFKKNPIKYDAALWLARTYNQMHKFEKAQPQLDIVKNRVERYGKKINLFYKLTYPFVKAEIPLNVYKELPLVSADYYIQQEKYLPAIEELNKAISLNKKKKIRSRLTFILAQIYQNTGNLKKATDYYRKVLRLNPAYEMAFNSKMNMAKCYDANNANSKDIKKELVRMLKDIKNKEYLDQIYYALAEISLKEHNQKEALSYLKLSAIKSSNNQVQKSLTYLKIADIYYSIPEYIYAQSYYDSTLAILSKDYPDYSSLEDKKNTLNSLAKFYKTLHFEDSVRVIAKMTPAEMNATVDKLIKDYEKKEEEKKQAEINKQINQAYYADNTTQNPNASNSQWYFYNSNTIKFGISDFLKKWGNRPLEDNWRLSDKKQSDFADNESNVQKKDSIKGDSSRSKLSTNPKDRKFYTQNIPLTKEQFAKSDEKIEEALYNLGFIYREGVKDYQKSVESFEELEKRFPESKHLMNAYYQLYKTYGNELPNKSKSEHYKDLLLTKFPESDYAKMISDPEYIKQMQANKNVASGLYNETYTAYINAQYDKVVENSNKALMSYKGNELLPKFQLLNALSIGKTKDVPAFKAALSEVVSRYPDSKAKDQAKNILEYIKRQENPSDPTSEKNKEAAKKAKSYQYNPDMIHLFVLLLDAKEVVLKDVKIAISNFDNEQFSTEKLNISSTFLTTDKQLITVSNFENKEKAMRYFNAFINESKISATFKQSKFQEFIITSDNYSIFFKNKDIDNYSKFFEENYKK